MKEYKMTLAEFKRLAASKNYEMQMIIRCGGTDIPDHLKGWRKIIGANTVDIFLLNNDGKKSFLSFPKASLFECDGQTLKTYLPGYRELNAEEKAIMQEWEKITKTEEYRKQAYADAYTDGSSTYWQEKHFFKDRNALYLMGLEEERGMKYDYASGLVRDCKIKGTLYMQYEIRKIGA